MAILYYVLGLNVLQEFTLVVMATTLLHYIRLFGTLVSREKALPISAFKLSKHIGQSAVGHFYIKPKEPFCLLEVLLIVSLVYFTWTVLQLTIVQF